MDPRRLLSFDGHVVTRRRGVAAGLAPRPLSRLFACLIKDEIPPSLLQRNLKLLLQPNAGFSSFLPRMRMRGRRSRSSSRCRRIQ